MTPDSIKRAKYRRRKPPITLPAVHDRRVVDLPVNAMVSPIEVVDPYSHTEDVHAEADDKGQLYPSRGARITVMRSIRGDPLGRLHAQHRIDDAQFNAGRRWQSLYELGGGSVQAIDTSKEPVDGGRFPDTLSDAQLNAIAQLRAADVALGTVLAPLVRAVLGERWFINEIAAHVEGDATARDEDRWGFMFRQALDALAEFFGLAGTGPTRRPKIKAWRN